MERLPQRPRVSHKRRRGLVFYHRRFLRGAASWIMAATCLFLLLAWSGEAIPSGDAYHVHIGSFKVKENALNFRDRVKDWGYDAYLERAVIPGKGIFFRVYVGQFQSEEAAKKVGTRMKETGLTEYTAVQKISAVKRSAASKGLETGGAKSKVTTAAVRSGTPPAANVGKRPKTPGIKRGRAIAGERLPDEFLPPEPVKSSPLDEQESRDWYRQGVEAFDRGDYDRATVNFTHALRGNPEFADAFFQRGMVYYYTRQYDQANDDFTRAISLDANRDAVFTRRGDIFNFTGKTDRALDDYTKAISLNEANDQAYLGRGLAYILKERPREALADISQACSINQDRCRFYKVVNDLLGGDAKKEEGK